jgi:hypothetical protein
VYVPDHEGDRIPEFGRVGYRKGANGLLSENLPSQGNVTIDNTSWPLAQPFAADPPLSSSTGICNPGAHDHGTAIQAAIDHVATLPANAEGVRGRVSLSRAHYAIWARLRLQSGVVLRGVSEHGGSGGTPPTTLHACGASSSALISASLPVSGSSSSQWDILDEVVPSGSNSVRIGASPADLGVGNVVTITRKSPLQWIRDIGLEHILDPGCSGPLPYCTSEEEEDQCCDQGWQPNTKNLVFQRVVTHVENGDDLGGRRVFFDQPFTNALESKYGAHTLLRHDIPPAKLRNMGVYNLRGVSHPTVRCNSGTPACSGGTAPACDPEDRVICSSGQPTCSGSSSAPTCGHSARMISLDDVEDVWIKEVIATGFSYAVLNLGDFTKQVTAEDVQYLSPLGPIDGTWRYPFVNSGTANLIANSYSSEGRHNFVPGTLSAGPNVFWQCQGENSLNDGGPHQRWATGTLFDGISLTFDPTNPNAPSSSAQLNVRNRYGSGSGHGWTGSSMVVWNSTAAGFRYFNPPTGQNWLIGSVGPAYA